MIKFNIGMRIKLKMPCSKYNPEETKKFYDSLSTFVNK